MHKIIFLILNLCIFSVWANDSSLENKLTKIDALTHTLIPLVFNSPHYYHPDTQAKLEENLSDLHMVFKDMPFKGMLSCLEETQKLISQKNLLQARHKIKALLSFCIACHHEERRNQTFMKTAASLPFESNFELAEFSYVTQDYQTAISYYDQYITGKIAGKSKEKIQLALERLLSMYTQIEKSPSLAADYLIEYVRYLGDYPELKAQVEQWIVELKNSDPALSIEEEGLHQYVNHVVSGNDKVPLIVLRGILFNDLNETLPDEKEKPQLIYWLALSSCKLSNFFYQ